jgi:hypothetical protein
MKFWQIGLGCIAMFSPFFSIQAENWTCAMDLSPPTTNNEDTIIVKADNNGNAFAVWVEGNNVTNVVRAARFDSGIKQWFIFSPLSTTNVEELQLAVTADGKAIAVWRRVDSDYTKIEYSTYQNGAWSASAKVDSTHSEVTLGQIRQRYQFCNASCTNSVIINLVVLNKNS